MAKEKIVRCIVSKIGSPQSGSVRYVPFDVFHLWKHLMVERHGFEVTDVCPSLWFDVDDDPNVTYSELNYEKVVRITLRLYSEEAGMLREVTRYFPLEDYEKIKERFLSHFEDAFTSSDFTPLIEETKGVWIKRDDSSR